MTSSSADNVVAFVAGLWRFAAKTPEQQAALSDGLRHINTTEAQARAALAQLARETSKTPTLATILARVRACEPPKFVQAPAGPVEVDEGPKMTLTEFIAGVAAGVYAPCTDSVPEGLRRHLDLSNPDSPLSVLVRSYQRTGTCSLNQIFKPLGGKA